MKKPFKTLFIATIILFALQQPAMAQEQPETATEKWFSFNGGEPSVQLKTVMEMNMQTLITTLNTAAEQMKDKIKLPETVIIPEARENLVKMWKYSHMSFPVKYETRCLSLIRGGYQARGVPVDILNADDDQKRQELTIDFDKAGRICNISISMEMQRYNEIIKENQTNSQVEFAQREKVVEFIENFRTAYNRKDLQYISSVFSDNALIITGTVVKPQKRRVKDQMTLSNGKVIYTSMNKVEYVERLTKVFKKNKYINVKFEDIEVYKNREPDIYSVTLKQYWNATGLNGKPGYSDVGFLLLIIDFKDFNNPEIWVRTWQPYKDLKTGEIYTRPEDAYRGSQFRLGNARF